MSSGTPEAKALLATLRSDRTVKKRHFTRVKNKAIGLYSDGEITALQYYSKALEDAFRAFQAVQQKIEALDEEDHAGDDVEDDFEVVFLKLSARLRDLQAQESASAMNSTLFAAASRPAQAIPAVKLPTFDGDCANFNNFMSTFKQLVDSNGELTDITKFNYLINCLQGRALDSVRAFQITAENYSKAKDRLTERFGNQVSVFIDNIKRFSDLPVMRDQCADSLRALVDNADAIIGSLQSLGKDAEIRDALFIHTVMSKVDRATKRRWNETLKYDKLPTWVECRKFLDHRCHTCNSNEADEQHNTRPVKSTARAGPVRQSSFIGIGKRSGAAKQCHFCKSGEHFISSCSSFRALSIPERWAAAARNNWCTNCLSGLHRVQACTSKHLCKTCGEAHHSLLHRAPSHSTPNTAAVHNHTASPSQAGVLLATAVILVQDRYGEYHAARALLDSCSQINFVSDKLAMRLQLKRERADTLVAGVGDCDTFIKHQAHVSFKSRASGYQTSLICAVTKKIFYQPDANIDISSWKIPNNVKLADEKFHLPQPVDILIGAEIFFDIMAVGQIKLGTGLPILQKTLLGWVTSGPYKNVSCFGSVAKHRQTQDDRQEQLDLAICHNLEQLWKVEEVGCPTKLISNEHAACEEHFSRTAEQAPDGRVVVSLPFKESPELLGDSRQIAFRRFLSLERRLSTQPEIRTEYSNFMKEYELLGHMSAVKEGGLPAQHYYIPHHCVLRPSSTTTKLRVVFDASAKTSSGVALNDILLVGPVVQPDLYSLLIKFRTYRFVVTADIVKMYRQVAMAEKDKAFQCIFWRDARSQRISTYKLNTVTYGTASAPYLATRALSYLADKYQETHPEGAAAIRTCFYVDDLICGANDESKLLQIRSQVTEILTYGQMELAKWQSNVSSFTDISSTAKHLDLDDPQFTKTLGISWQPKQDKLFFIFNDPGPSATPVTKRVVLSLASSLYDPLGILAPFIVNAKILLQELWMLKLQWDESLPQSHQSAWERFMAGIPSLTRIEIPRYCLAPYAIHTEWHGFCDASIRAYGCCLYLRCTDTQGNIQVSLLTAKSRVAPIRKRTLPQLELCSAHLLSTLLQKVQPLVPANSVYLWSDSALVLHWMTCHSATLSTFVGNRIADIQELTVSAKWRHVPGVLNPADIVSRGDCIDNLIKSHWLSGPEFLKLEQDAWPTAKVPQYNEVEASKEKRKSVFVAVETTSEFLQSVLKAGNYRKIIHTVAWMLRVRKKPESSTPELVLTAAELEKAHWFMVHKIQQFFYRSEIRDIELQREVRGSIRLLTPFIEKEQTYDILKVGGRLELAELPELTKHPALLPYESKFTQYYVEHLHRKNYHAGPKALVALLRQTTWVVNARRLARKVVNSCVLCMRYKPKLQAQMMGNLPKERITPCAAFAKCGVDYCGPINIYQRIRGKPPTKAYIAIYVCMATKAVHIELVSDLTTNAFMASLKRFAGRRGLPTDIYCDNGTNFVGANNRLADVKAFLYSKDNQQTIIGQCADEFIDFHFIPPRAPHFGGLWEAAVKSAKTLLQKSTANTRFNYEEAATVLINIEAILNSRPLTPLSTDPNDCSALTPGHLLIGRPLRAVPERPVTDQNIGVSNHWAQITALNQHFWHRWSREYIDELRQRTKWTGKQANVAPGDLVLIKEDNLRPQQWAMGRVLKCITGKDDLVRVVDIRTASGTLRRPIHKLALLPVKSD